MAGRKPQRVFVYDEEGKYICMFDSMVDFRKVYYPKDLFKRPLFTHEELSVKYHYMDDIELIAFSSRTNRDLIKRIIAIHNSEYCKKEDNDTDKKSVEVFNLKNELIAEFKTARLLTKLMPHINQATLSRHLNTKDIHAQNILGLFFKYKE